MAFKTLIGLLILLSSQIVFGQTQQLFENIEFTDSMKLVIMHPHFDEKDTFVKYDLIIDKKNTFDSIASLFTYGQEVTNYFNRNEPSIILLSGTKTIDRWSINPEVSSIRVKGKSYKFDTDIVLELASKYPLKYSYERIEFNSQEEFDNFQSDIIKDSTLLFMYKPNFNYDGSFDLRFTKSRKFKHPKGITEYLEPIVLKITGEKNFRISYIANSYNMSHPDQYTMTIKCKRSLFDQFEDKNAEKLDWVDEIYSATAFKNNYIQQ